MELENVVTKEKSDAWFFCLQIKAQTKQLMTKETSKTEKRTYPTQSANPLRSTVVLFNTAVTFHQAVQYHWNLQKWNLQHRIMHGHYKNWYHALRWYATSTIQMTCIISINIWLYVLYNMQMLLFLT